MTEPNPTNAKHDFPTEEFDPFLLADDSDWLVIEPVLVGERGEEIADALCRLLFNIIEAFEAGEESRAVHTLKDGVRILYKYTRAHKMALKLYYLSLSCNLPPGDEPEELIGAALARAEKLAMVESRGEKNGDQ
ncbi:MAG TPA: hypothetical protein VJ302_31975 [Blastocatellia bacterium]|nr:hypothetical protein [Blastocatellia bacterium]